MNDTIAAISTAHAPGAIGVIRISGTRVLEISSSILQKNHKQFTPQEIKQNNRKAVFCELIDGDKNLDQILFLFFQGPNSFTGEDMAEFHLHGNQILLRKALELMFAKGARPATEGEFSKRGFLNGKMDLSGTEAIARLISARSRFELELAQKNVFGELSRLSSQIRSELINLKAECEAEIDFSTEDLTFESLEERKARVKNLMELCSNILKKSEQADSIINHQKIVLYGEPNTGKSSLMNKLIGRDRAIISEIPGTTRDYITEDLSIEGIPIKLVDTAGVRHTEDEIEKKGIELSRKEFKNANIQLYILDASLPSAMETFMQDREILQNAIIVANKIDSRHPDWDKNQLTGVKTICEISCKTGEGIDALLHAISGRLKNEEDSGEYVILEERNKHHFRQIRKFLENTLRLIGENAYAEVYIREIDDALNEIGFVNGVIYTEEVLGRIFSRFCVGK